MLNIMLTPYYLSIDLLDSYLLIDFGNLLLVGMYLFAIRMIMKWILEVCEEFKEEMK